MSKQIIFCHPDDSSLTWSGFGFRPSWWYDFLAAGGTEEQAAHAAVRAGYRSAEGVPGYIETVTKKQESHQVADQADLPGLPPVPKKRGRPVTGKAKTAAERKRESRERAIRGEVENYKTFSNYQLCEAITRQVARIAEKDPEFLDSQKWHYDRLIAELSSRVAAI